MQFPGHPPHPRPLSLQGRGEKNRNRLQHPQAVTAAPDGRILVADTGDYRTRVLQGPDLLACSGGASVCLPSTDGEEVYGFDATGRHLWTKFAIGGGMAVETAARLPEDCVGLITMGAQALVDAALTLRKDH